jgi:hypothetical protein
MTAATSSESQSDSRSRMTYRYEDEIPMEKGHTLDQMTGRFQSIKDGLPELVKNAKDQYVRLGLQARSERDILVAVSTRRKSMLVLDLGGARYEHFQDWKIWSSRTASQAKSFEGVEGGHGNGGKAFMVRGSDNESFLESVIDGGRTRLGFDNRDKARRYIPGVLLVRGEPVTNLPCPNVGDALARILSDVDLEMDDLPASLGAAFLNRQAYTAVVLKGLHDWGKIPPATVRARAFEIAAELAGHPQAEMSIASCHVFVLVDGVMSGESPLQIIPPPPLSGFESIPAISVPSVLVDPSTQAEVSMDSGVGSYGHLKLDTSSSPLRQSERTRPRNVLKISNAVNVIAFWPMSDLVPTQESSYIYGHLVAPILNSDHTVGAERIVLADTAEVRALRKWCESQVHELALEIRAARSTETSVEDRSKASKTLDRLRELMRQFLEPDADDESPGSEPDTIGEVGRGLRRVRKGTSYGSVVDMIEIEQGRARVAFAVGTTLPLRLRAFQKTADGSLMPVRSFTRELRGADGLLHLDESGQVTVLAPGIASAYVYCPETGVSSNTILVECVACDAMEVVGPDRPIMQGERVEIPYEHATEDGARADLLVQAWTEPEDLGSIGRRAMFTAGSSAGIGRICFQYGGNDKIICIPVSVSEEVAPRKGRGGTHGSDIPLILLCGDEAPGFEDRPPSDRTHPGGDDVPTIIEDPLFGSVLWINPKSKESSKVREAAGLRSIANKTFYQFLALKCFEILKRLWVRQSLGENSVLERQYVQELAEAEMDCASFVEDAYILAEALSLEKAS